MRYNYYYCTIMHPKLRAILDENNIEYQVTYGNLTPTLISFNICNPSGSTYLIMEEISECFRLKPIITAEYSASELRSANLIWMTPKRQCIDILNGEDAYEFSCGTVTASGMEIVRHRKQRSSFIIAKEPSLNTRTAFWAPDTGFAEIFTDQRIFELAQFNNISGVVFREVFLANGVQSKNLYQMTSSVLIDRKCIVVGKGDALDYCPICGEKRIVLNNAYQLKLDVSKIQEQSDVYVTESIFGEGIAYPLYLISQRFYQIIKKNKLAANVTFSPVCESN